MQFPLIPLDFFNLLFLPLMWLTLVEVKNNWSSLWDDELTAHDRYLLQRMVIFWLIPLVVLCHELGHVMAIKFFGGQVVEFHYAFMWGYVIPGGKFNTTQLVWLYLAGNLVQVVIGFAALLLALKVKSPPFVAMLVYLMLWSVGGTAVIYALLSFTGLYGDWVNIYTAQAGALVSVIGAVHFVLVAFVFWCLYSETAKTWFVARTNPNWLAEQKVLWSQLKAYSSATILLNLAWSYYQVGLNGHAWRCLLQAESAGLDQKEGLLLKGALEYRKRHFIEAEAQFKSLLADNELASNLRARALIAQAGLEVKTKRLDQAISTYTQAIEANPTIADAHFYKAMLLIARGQSEEALKELTYVADGQWLDSSLANIADHERKALTEKLAQKQ